MPHSVLWKLASEVLTSVYKTKFDLMITLFYIYFFSITHAKRQLLNLFYINLNVTWSNLV